MNLLHEVYTHTERGGYSLDYLATTMAAAITLSLLSACRIALSTVCRLLHHAG